MYEAWLPRHPVSFSCLIHELMGRNVEGQRRFLCSIVRWFLFYNKLHMPDQQHQNYKAAAWHNGWTFVKPLLSKSTVQNIIYFCLYIQNKDIFHLVFFFPPLLSILFFNRVIFLFLFNFFYTPCPGITSASFFSGILLPSLILQLCFSLSCSSSVLSNYIFFSSESLISTLMLSSNAAWPHQFIPKLFYLSVRI